MSLVRSRTVASAEISSGYQVIICDIADGKPFPNLSNIRSQTIIIDAKETTNHGMI